MYHQHKKASGIISNKLFYSLSQKYDVIKNNPERGITYEMTYLTIQKIYSYVQSEVKCNFTLRKPTLKCM